MTRASRATRSMTRAAWSIRATTHSTGATIWAIRALTRGVVANPRRGPPGRRRQGAVRPEAARRGEEKERPLRIKQVSDTELVLEAADKGSVLEFKRVKGARPRSS